MPQTNSGGVRDQPGLPVPEASRFWDLMDVNMYDFVYHQTGTRIKALGLYM